MRLDLIVKAVLSGMDHKDTLIVEVAKTEAIYSLALAPSTKRLKQVGHLQVALDPSSTGSSLVIRRLKDKTFGIHMELDVDQLLGMFALIVMELDAKFGVK